MPKTFGIQPKKRKELTKKRKVESKLNPIGTEDLGGGYARDKNHAYYNGKIIISVIFVSGISSS